jgi:tetratricopeptide (TPR) repeat protein
MRYAARIQRLAISRPVQTGVLLGAITIALICCAVYFLLRPSYQSRQLARGIVFQQSQDFEAAIESFNEALDGDAERHEALYERARTYLKQGNVAAARADFSQLWNDHADPRSAAYIGYCFNLRGNMTSAIPWYEDALKKGYESVGVHNNLAVSYAKGRSQSGTGHQLATAQAHLAKALVLDSSSLTVRANLVMLAIMRSDDYAEDELEQSSVHLEFLRNALPRSRRVMTDAVQLYGILSLRNQADVDKAIQAIELSLRCGCGPTVRELSTNPRFDRLRQDIRFAGLQTSADLSITSPGRDDLATFIDPILRAE